MAARPAPIRVLTFTSLYPNAVQPRHGIFVEHRMRQALATGELSLQVLAPVPWVPVPSRAFGRFRVLANVPRSEVRYGVHVLHPRFPAVPKLTSWFNPFGMALASLPAMLERSRIRTFDVIDAHFLYPDGAAAVLLGKWLRKPVVVTARGTDVNEFPRYPVPRRWIRWVAQHADSLITVSSALREALIRIGAPPERVNTLRNGVDLELFAPRDREALRGRLGFQLPTLLSVGHLVEGKGHQVVLEALARLPGVQVVIIGEGPLRTALHASADRLGVADRVKWFGTLPQTALAEFYCAADATVLASRIEGMPNVLLESLACGTPVIATAVGGNPEVVTAPEAGILIDERTPGSLCEGYWKLMRDHPSADATRRHAEQFGWGPTVQKLLEVFRSAAATGGRSNGHGKAFSESARQP